MTDETFDRLLRNCIQIADAAAERCSGSATGRRDRQVPYALFMPGPNEPSGFILTTILGIVGAFVATFLGQAVGWYRAGEGAGLIGAVVGAVIVLAIWGAIASRRSSTL